MTTDAPEPEQISVTELSDAWPALSLDDRLEGFAQLPPVEADPFFLSLSPRGQAYIIVGLPSDQRRRWMRLLPPDDAADVLQELPDERRYELLGLLDEPTRTEVTALMAYAEDDAGGLMSPRFARLRPEMTADEAIRYLRLQARERHETIYYVYVLDAEQHLLGAMSFRELFAAQPSKRVQEIMRPRSAVVAVPEDMDQEAVAALCAQHDLLALPVVDAEDRVRGIVTIDDIVDVVQEEATEDVQKMGGMEALDAPYLQTRFWPMIKKRGGWLSVLCLGEMLTTTAMGRFTDEIRNAVVLAVFVPLIISSGGNSGSQASTLVIRAMALGQVKLRDWARIVRRELMSGLTLGALLGTIGVIRIVAWHFLFGSYPEHAGWLAVTVGLSLIGVVTWGTLAGSMLPFVLRRAGLDPASASAPLVATLVDVSGLIIYFELGRVVLGGLML